MTREKEDIDQKDKSPYTLWTYKDLARFLQVSVDKVRHDVMNRKIPFIKIGSSVRFDKNQIADFLKIKIDNVDKQTARPNPKQYHHNSIDNIAAWLIEKARQYPFAEIGVKLIIHDGKIRKIEKMVVEKIQDKLKTI